MCKNMDFVHINILKCQKCNIWENLHVKNGPHRFHGGYGSVDQCFAIV